MKALGKWLAMIFRRLTLPSAATEKERTHRTLTNRDEAQRELVAADEKHHRQMRFVKVEERELDRRIEEIQRYVSASRG